MNNSFSELMQRYPNNMQTFYYYGKIKAEVFGDYNAAIRLYNQALAIASFFEEYKSLTMRFSLDNKLSHLVMFGKPVGKDMKIDMDKFKENYDFLLK